MLRPLLDPTHRAAARRLRALTAKQRALLHALAYGTPPPPRVPKRTLQTLYAAGYITPTPDRTTYTLTPGRLTRNLHHLLRTTTSKE